MREANAALYGVNKAGLYYRRQASNFAPWFVKFMQNMQLPPGNPKAPPSNDGIRSDEGW
jgi:hypothetical protein